MSRIDRGHFYASHSLLPLAVGLTLSPDRRSARWAAQNHARGNPLAPHRRTTRSRAEPQDVATATETEFERALAWPKALRGQAAQP